MGQSEIKPDTKQPQAKDEYPRLSPDLVAQLRALLDAQPESKGFKN